jgi:hypothetical protein
MQVTFGGVGLSRDHLISNPIWHAAIRVKVHGVRGGHNGNPGLGGGPSIIHDELSKRGFWHVLCLHSGWSPSSWTAYTDKYCYFSNVRRVVDSDFLAGTGIVRTAAYGKMLRKQQWLWLLPAALVLVC